MKILITNTGPWGTGSFTVAYAVLKELQKLGHEVLLFFPDAGLQSQFKEEYYSKPEFKIWNFPLKKGSIEIESFPLMIPDPHPRAVKQFTFKEMTEEQMALYFESAKEQLTQVIRAFQPDIIECQHIWAMDHIIEEMNLPYVCTAHHSDQMGFRYDTRIQPLALESAQKAGFIFAISEYVKNDVVSLYHIPEEKVIVLGNGYDFETFHPMKLDRRDILHELDLDLPEDAILVSFAGKLSKTKGADTVLEANYLLGANSKVHFLMFGSGQASTIFPTHDEYELDRVHFLGHVMPSLIARVHNICDFFIMPSRSEGFGIACLEAMACGLPVIATKEGGLEEFAIGKLIKSADPIALAEAIREMVSMSKGQMNELSDSAIEVAKTYSWKSITQERVKYYQKAKEKSRV